MFIDAPLVHHTTGVLQMNSIICSYMPEPHLFHLSLKPGIQTFYFQLTEKAGHDWGTTSFSEFAHWALSREQRNAKAILLDSLKYRPVENTILASIHYSDYLTWNVPSLEVPQSVAEAIKHFLSPETISLLFGYISENSTSS